MSAGTTGTSTAETLVEPDDEFVTFEHGVTDGEVLIRAWGADGEPVGYNVAVEIEPGVHEVSVIPGLAVRLTAEPDTTEPPTE